MDGTLIKADKNNKVRKSEVLIQSRYDLNSLPMKFITAIISALKPSDETDRRYIFKVRDFIELINEDYSNIYKYVKEAVKELLQKPLEIQTEDGWIMANWISSAEYKEGEGTITFLIDPVLRPYLLEAKERFLIYSLHNILPLKSKYSMRMYELLRDWYNQEQRYRKNIVKVEKIIELEWLRKTLKLPESYKYNDFKRFILQKAQKELRKHTDIEFDFEEIKTGRKITHIKFKIFDKNAGNNNNNTKTKSNNTLVDEKLQTLLHSLKTKENIKLEYIYDAYLKYGYEYVKRNIDYANKHATDNYAAYLTKALKEDWATTSKQRNSILESKEYQEYQQFVGKKVNIQGTTYEVDQESLYNIRTNTAIPIGDILKNWNYWKPYFEK